MSLPLSPFPTKHRTLFFVKDRTWPTAGAQQMGTLSPTSSQSIPAPLMDDGDSDGLQQIRELACSYTALETQSQGETWAEDELRRPGRVAKELGAELRKLLRVESRA